MRISGPSLQEVKRRSDAIAVDTRRALTATFEQVAAELSDPVTLDDLAVFHRYWDEQVEKRLMPHVEDAYRSSVVNVRNRIGAALANLTASAADDIGVPLVQNNVANLYMRQAQNHLVGVGDEAWEYARQQLSAGMIKGESVPKLRARLIDDANHISGPRGEVIARTEVNGAMNGGSLDEMKATGLPSTKEWLASVGKRTRLSHALVNGQKVDVREKFIVGGYPMDRPHDADGPAEQVVNCRCTLAFDIDDDVALDCMDCLSESTGDESQFSIAETLFTDVDEWGEGGDAYLDVAALNFLKSGLPEQHVIMGSPLDLMSNRKWAKDMIARDLEGRTQQTLTRSATLEMLEKIHETEWGWLPGGDPRYNLMSDLIQFWAQTSGDTRLWPLALQQAARDEFGLKLASTVDDISHHVVPAALKSLYEKWTTPLRRFIRAMYESTQDRFRQQGIKQVVLYRGMSFKELPKTLLGKGVGDTITDLTWNPMSSWSTSYNVANAFTGEHRYDVIVQAVVPVDRVVGTSRTGFGCLGEAEYVVMDTRGPVRIAYMYDNSGW